MLKIRKINQSFLLILGYIHQINKKLLKFEHFIALNEYNTQNKGEVLAKEKLFTVSYEIELSSQKEYEDYDVMEYEYLSVFKPLMNKWGLTIVSDTTLNDYFNNTIVFDPETTSEADFLLKSEEPVYRGLEIVPDTYFHGLVESFNFLDDFYALYEKQKIFFFSKKTGLHINIGYVNTPRKNWNVIKGFLLLNEDYSLKGYEYRKDSEFAGSLKPIFRETVKDYIVQNYGRMTTETIRKNLDQIILDLNNRLYRLISTIDEKRIGFNISKIYNSDYIEFRYPGGVVKKDDIIFQTTHYANIVMACCDPEYRKKDFYHKLFSFLLSFDKIS